MLLLNSYQSLPPLFFAAQNPEHSDNPECVLYNTELAKELEIDEFIPAENAHSLLSGNSLPDGAKPIAQAYAGHQFGYPNMLGDGRAILLGEWQTANGKLVDIVLKGSGKTSFSRGGDGRATLYSMLREYLISEAMQALHIATSRSLAVVTTGEKVFRESVQDGAILTRVMSSHIRIGTFEFAKNFGSTDDMQALINYTIDRHYPELKECEYPVVELLKTVIDRQTSLIIEWMRVGFIHGVMNTDNSSIGGETFDYGPCAFLNTFHPATVFSSIDTRGRYAFGNQPRIIEWNLSVFAETLSDFLDSSLKEKILAEIPEILRKKWFEMMGKKLGITEVFETDEALILELLDWMQQEQADYTNTFLYISGKLPGELSEIYEVAEFQDWMNRWKARVNNQDGKIEKAITSMQEYNPVYIPRNHLVEEVLKSAVSGDMEAFHIFLKILKNPYTQQDISQKYIQNPKGCDESYETFCGT